MTDRPLYDGQGNRIRYWTGPPRKRAKSTKPREHPEADFQSAVVEYLTWALPARVLWTATLNGAYLSAKQRMGMKRAGMRRGISDIVLVDPASRGAFFLECKPPEGPGQHKRHLTPEQQQWNDALGSRWQTCQTLEQVETALRIWGIEPTRPIARANRFDVSDLL